MKKVVSVLFSTRTMAVLLFLYAALLAYATFVENNYGTPAAKVLVYDAKWFELLQLLLIVNFVGNISRYRLWRKEKWPLLVFHLSFVLIFIGGGISRYISYEGMMTINEGESSNEIISNKTFFKLGVESKGERRLYNDIPFAMTKLPFDLPHTFQARYQFFEDEVQLKTIDFVPRAKDSLIEITNGKKILKIVSTSDNGRENIYIESGTLKRINGLLVGYNVDNFSAIQINEKEGQFYITSPYDAEFMVMATQQNGAVKANETQAFNLRSLYTINNLKLVVPELPKIGKLQYFEGDKTKDKDVNDKIWMEISFQNKKDTVLVTGGKGNIDLKDTVKINGTTFFLGYGSKKYTTDFFVKLRDFQLERYPGSMSPSSYASEVSVIDEGTEKSYRIYMNNVLDYKGYRFFQSSFTPDEQGTILSVNHDFWGTLITYIGYGLLFLGMLVTLFWKGTRFWKLNSQLNEIISSKNKITAFLLCVSVFSFAQHSHTKQQDMTKQIPIDSITKNFHLDKKHSDKFGTLLVQHYDGRIKPVNTLAREILQKLSKKDQFGTLDANQWFMATLMSPSYFWTNTPIIKVGNDASDEIKKKLKVNEDGLTSMNNMFFFDKNGNFVYILEQDFNNAFRKRAADKSKSDNEVIKINDRVQVIQQLISGQYYTFIPKRYDANQKWTSGIEMTETGTKISDTLAYAFINNYSQKIAEANQSKDFTKADEALAAIQKFQKDNAKNIIPSDEKIAWEIRNNNWNLFFWLMIVYSVLGSLLFANSIAKFFVENKIVNFIEKFLLNSLLVALFVHLFAIALRWYITGHAPWSNGYEAVMFISFVSVLAVYILNVNSFRKFHIVLTVSAILSAAIITYSFDLEWFVSMFVFLGSYFCSYILYKLGMSLFGILRKNTLENSITTFIQVAGCFAAVIMMGFAHGAVELEPQITPLQPVLKSYWLNIHVAIITSSYGFLGLSALIGFISLVIFSINSSRLVQKVHESTKELAIVNEMSLTIGIFLLTIGTFSGGIWANESWGRYWSWDPKETWAYISIIVYAFVLHLRLVPKLQNKWLFNFTTLLAFSSIIMTYFGVNYYLSGLHSYATGDRIPIPLWIYITIAIVVILGVISFIQYRNFFWKREIRNQMMLEENVK